MNKSRQVRLLFDDPVRQLRAPSAFMKLIAPLLNKPESAFFIAMGGDL
jgi:hypothetical protein